MAIAPFAALESRVNSAVFARLSNAAVSVNGAQAVGGIFDDGAAVGAAGPLGMATSQPSVMVPSATVPADVAGLQASVNGVLYLVAASEPDGAGITRLLLEAA